MKRLATLIVAMSMVLLTASATRAEAPLLLFDYVGFDYESPDLNAGQFGEVGSGYVGVGTVENLFSPLVFNEIANEYTYMFSGLTATARNVFGDFVVVDYSAGSLSVYEDSRTTGTPAQYGVEPPNTMAPGRFTDGTLILSGTLSNFQFVFNSVNNSGSYNADFLATGGSQIGNIAPGDRAGWTFSGATGNATNIPLGYHHQIDGQVFLTKPTSTRASTWGAVKAIYR
jgi:hypothetical protein